jgi:hypothetical protein
VFRGYKPPPKKHRRVKRLGLHLCNVQACINPWHLKIGTQRQNQRQAVQQGRHDPWSGVKARRMKTAASRGRGKLVVANDLFVDPQESVGHTTHTPDQRGGADSAEE